MGAASAQAKPGKTTEKNGVEKSVSDNVTLSPRAQALGAQTSGDQVFDAIKVEQIKAAIANGTFQINPARVADGLIESVKDLLSAQKG